MAGDAVRVPAMMPSIGRDYQAMAAHFEGSLEDDAMTWKKSLETEPLPISALREGHDVWLVNRRGSKYSSKKTTDSTIANA